MAENLSSGEQSLTRRHALAERFDLIRSLGEGASGGVFLVRDLRHGGREVALKILEDPEAFDEHTLMRFKEELETLRTIRHPNLIEAYDLIDLGDTVAYTMECVDGHDLARFVRQRTLTFEDIDRICMQVLSALEELHSRNILHRDIKLENILWRRDGNVKLSDLGLMKKLDAQGLTRAGLLLGTAQYMPPEYIKRGKYDARGDLYALGIMIYELLVGKRRFADMPGNKVIEHLIKTKFALPELALTDIPMKYRNILRRALDPDPQQRYQSASEMRAAIAGRGAGPGPGEGGVVLSSHLTLGEFDQNRPLVAAWAKSAAYRSRGTLRRYCIGVTAFSFLSVLAFFHVTHVTAAVELLPGLYQGSISGFKGPLRSLQIRAGEHGLVVEDGLPECRGREVLVKERALRCTGASYQFEISGARPDGFSGSLTNLQNHTVHEFDLRLTRK